MREARALGRSRRLVLATEDDGAVLHVGPPHAGAKLDEILVGVHHAPLDDLRGPGVIAALI
jgi:hypothetical protein